MDDTTTTTTTTTTATTTTSIANNKENQEKVAANVVEPSMEKAAATVTNDNTGKDPPSSAGAPADKPANEKPLEDTAQKAALQKDPPMGDSSSLMTDKDKKDVAANQPQEHSQPEEASKIGQDAATDATTTGAKDDDLPTGNNKQSADQASKEKENTTQLQRPIKRARTAYFIFCDAKRPQVQKEHAGQSVGVVAKALGQLWKDLPEQEKQAFQKKAAEERAQVQAELKALEAAGLLGETSKHKNAATNSNNTTLAFPVAKIRKIVKLDPEVRGVKPDALQLITKAAELFVEKIGLESVRVAAVQNRRKLLPEDIVMVCQTKSAFAFLRDDLQDLVAAQQQQQQQQQSEQSSMAGSKRKADESSGQSNKLTSYFSVKPKEESS